MAKNKISFIHENIQNCAELTEIDLEGNKIPSLPASLSKLDKLVKINLDGNLLESLPESFASLKIEILSLANNPLKKIPQAIGNLPCLRELDLQNS